MFIIKATLRDETRRISFDVHGFPNYSEIQDRVSRSRVANAPAVGGNDIARRGDGLDELPLRAQPHENASFSRSRHACTCGVLASVDADHTQRYSGTD